MRFTFPASALACALLPAFPAAAHVVAGTRVFPVTLTFDDPGVNDEVSIPAISYQRIGPSDDTGAIHQVNLGFEFDKRITEKTAIVVNTGYQILQSNGAKTQTGFQNLFVTGKWQILTNAPHEAVVSLGVIRELGGTGTLHTGADKLGATSPTLYFGKGLGDLPVQALRPLAITGELSYTVADKRLKAFPTLDGVGGNAALSGMAQLNNGNNNAWSAGLSVQYSIPYLQAQVKNVGLTGVLADVIPLVEFTWSSPASTPSNTPTRFVAAPGAVYLTNWGEIGVEALIPLNKAAGPNIGVVGLVHVFFDDLFPTTIGRPIFQ